MELARAHNALHIGGSRFVRRPSERPWLHHQISVVNPRTSLIEVESKPLGWVFPTVLCFASLHYGMFALAGGPTTSIEPPLSRNVRPSYRVL